MFLPENIKCVLLYGQDNFEFLASKLKFSSKVDQYLLLPLSIYVGVSLFYAVLEETSQMFNLHIFIQEFIEENPRILYRPILVQFLDSNSSNFGTIATQPGRVKVITSLEKT
jgi:hypothetical protein